MKFTYKAYEELVELIREKGYSFTGYGSREERFVIMRHDVDFDLEKAAQFGSFERQLGIKSTYMVLVSTNFYNIFSAEGGACLQKLLEDGHSVGLHFDESKYQITHSGQRKQLILDEIGLLQQAVGREVTALSMHRPGRDILAENLHIPGIENSYSDEYFTGIKYVSDSRCRWKEDVERIIREREADRLQILTHPFWYHEKEQSAGETIRGYVDRAGTKYYRWLENNITDMAALMAEDESGNKFPDC